jgi:hypothetical protein
MPLHRQRINLLARNQQQSLPTPPPRFLRHRNAGKQVATRAAARNDNS